MQSIALLIGLSMVATTGPAEPQSGRWITLGTTTLRLNSSQGMVRVRGTDRYREVRLCVERRPVRINSARIEFARGGPQVLPIRRVVDSGNCTGPDALARSNMRTVRVDFERLRSGARPIVSVQARW
ncbi:MAG: hypothetical protein MT490_02020 [Sphingomonas sp.]|uniref:hypothetical protein n=1 Tax=Sphingomonas sp. TaxID=28214 RepID=UPI0022726E2C|nr:hypothetical protein [Sphingomonas sp.]MCX8474549.1 hypothetical protein [Sphingomonas sp.]